MNWIVNTLLKRYLKGVLDKLPLNNYKTFISLVTFFIIEILKIVDSSGLSHDLLTIVLDAIAPYASNVQLSALVGAIVGVVHKILKKAFD